MESYPKSLRSCRLEVPYVMVICPGLACLLIENGLLPGCRSLELGIDVLLLERVLVVQVTGLVLGSDGTCNEYLCTS